MNNEIAPHTNAITPPDIGAAEENRSIIETNEREQGEKEIPQLPSPRENGGEYKEFKLGETMTMDELGPMIITPEGYVRRIANWANMTKAEQAVAWRRISARNKQRIEALKEAEKQEIPESEDNSNNKEFQTPEVDQPGDL
eukprot:gene12021-13129_t